MEIGRDLGKHLADERLELRVLDALKVGVVVYRFQYQDIDGMDRSNKPRGLAGGVRLDVSVARDMCPLQEAAPKHSIAKVRHELPPARRYRRVFFRRNQPGKVDDIVTGGPQ
jgi:hypothetical protein